MPSCCALFGIASLVDAADRSCRPPPALPYKLTRIIVFQPVDAQRQGLHHQHIGKLVHHQSRQEICLTENQAAA